MFSFVPFILKYRKVLIGIVIVLPLIYLYFDYTSTKDFVLELTKENAELVTKLEQNESVLQNVITQQEKLANQFEIISNSFNDIRNENIRLARNLRQTLSSPEISKDVIKTETIINNITKNMNRCFEILSGSELTEEERNATTPEEFNSECPFLFSTDK